MVIASGYFYSVYWIVPTSLVRKNFEVVMISINCDDHPITRVTIWIGVQVSGVVSKTQRPLIVKNSPKSLAITTMIVNCETVLWLLVKPFLVPDFSTPKRNSWEKRDFDGRVKHYKGVSPKIL